MACSAYGGYHRARPNSDVEADVALSRGAPSGPRSLTPVVIPTETTRLDIRRPSDAARQCGATALSCDLAANGTQRGA